MATFSVNDQTRRIRAVVSSTEQQEFSVAFQSNQTTDIKVFVDGTQKTEGTHYDIKDTTGGSAVNGIAADGTCVVKFRHDSGAGIDHRPTQNQVVTIISDIALARTSVYTAGGNITAASLESDFDTVTMQMAEREEAASRALTAPKFDPTDIDMTLPDKDARKGKGLAFNATTGNPEATTFGDITSISAGNGIAGGGTTGAITIEIDSTVATLTGSQTLTNKTIDASQLVGTIADGLIPEAASDSAGLMPAADKAKLDGIEASADVTDAANVTAAGALMDSEVTNLAEVKAFSSADYATAAQGVTADAANVTANAALPKAGGTMSGDLNLNNNHLILDDTGGNNTSINAPFASAIYFTISGTNELLLQSFALRPNVDKGLSLGHTSDRWDVLYANTANISVADGTAPLVITSTTKVDNLNVDKLDDQDGSYYLDAGNFTGTFSNVDIDGGAIDGVTIGTNSAVTDLRVDRLKLNTNTISNTTTNDHITLAPNGTGDVRMVTDGLKIGDSNADVTLTTIGTGDLTLSTNEGTDTGTIVIADGANGNISLTPDGTGVVQIDGSNGVSIESGVVSVKNGGTQSEVRLYCESSNAHYAGLKAPAHSEFSGDVTSTLPAATGILIGTANADAPATTTSSSDADHVLVNDGGVLKKITPANLGIGGGGGGGGSFLPLSGGTLTGDLTLGGALVEEVYNLTGQVLDPSNGTLQYKILGGNTTFTETFSDGESITLMIDDGAAYTVTWPTMTWASGSAPTLATSGYTTVVLWHQGQLYGAVAS